MDREKTYRDGILEHQIYQRLESSVACYSQSLLLADLQKTLLSSGLKNLTIKKKQETRVYS